MSGVGGIGGAGGINQILAMRQQIIEKSSLLQQVKHATPAAPATGAAGAAARRGVLTGADGLEDR